MPHCVFLESGVSINIDGSYKPCCQFEWQNSAPVEYDDFLSLRKQKKDQMKADWIPECEVCRQDEIETGSSMRKDSNDEIKGTFYEVWFDNTCNLSCRMCNAFCSSTWRQNIKHHGQLNWHDEYVYEDKPNFVKFEQTPIYKDLANLRYLKILGGEPFMMKEVNKTLTKIKETNHAGHINLNITSNLTHSITDWWVDMFSSFKTVNMIGSVDGIYSRYEYIRPGARFEKVMETIQQIKNLKKILPTFKFHISCTGQTLNASQHKAIKKFWTNENIDCTIEPIYSPDFISYKSLNPALRNKFGLSTHLPYEDSCWSTLEEQMAIQDQVHGTSFKQECPELFEK